MKLENKKVTVVGLGNSGLNASIVLDDLGAFVRVTEKADNEDVRHNIERLEHRAIGIEVGSHTKSFVEGSELVVLSPGVEDCSLPVKWALELGVPIISEMELGYRLCKGRIIGVTGTNGKSTVATLIGGMLKDAGFETVVCGNIGNALCGEVDRITKDHWVVLEVSSFQLEWIDKFKPHISIILNITDDHQDRYPNFTRYFNEKLKIFKNQDKHDFLILNYDAPNLRNIKTTSKPEAKVLCYSKGSHSVQGMNEDGRTVSAFTKENKVTCVWNRAWQEICDVSDIRLKGTHNLENVLASCLASTIVGAGAKSMKGTLRRFIGLHHRFETADIIAGVEFIDDSKGTTVDSTMRALESLSKAVVLIAGGRDKNSDYSAVRGLIRRKVKGLILIGEAKNRIKEAIGDLAPTVEARTMKEAVEEAFKLAKSGDVVLLSPMCSSFDMFRDYRHRGEIFQEAVRKIKNSWPASQRYSQDRQKSKIKN